MILVPYLANVQSSRVEFVTHERDINARGLEQSDAQIQIPKGNSICSSIERTDRGAILEGSISKPKSSITFIDLTFQAWKKAWRTLTSN